MQRKSALFIQLFCVIMFIVAFSLPWIEKGFISVSGFSIPLLNEKATKITNIFYTFTPLKKSMPKIGYVFYIVPLLSFMGGICLFTLKKYTSKYILLLSAIFGIVFTVYFYSSFKLSMIGHGPHLLLATSVAYIILFFTPLIKSKKTEGITMANDVLEKSDEHSAIKEHLDSQNP